MEMLHIKTTSAKRCLDCSHRDCLREMCNKCDIDKIEQVKIFFDKNTMGNRINNSDIDILSYMCELSDFDAVKLLIETYNYNPNNDHSPLRGYDYLLSSICFGKNFDIFYIFIIML